MIAALYVETNGCYFGLPGVDPWDIHRDARTYPGPWPVVAHPPCQRWGVWASSNPNPKARKRTVGDDDGCFEAALRDVRRWGGVIEHPRGSRAWGHFKLPRPRTRGWGDQDAFGGRTCRVDQGRYGHPNPKPTWLYLVAPIFPELDWGRAVASQHLSTMSTYRSREDRMAAYARGEKLPKRPTYRERLATPPAFRDLLLSLVQPLTTHAGQMWLLDDGISS